MIIGKLLLSIICHCSARGTVCAARRFEKHIIIKKQLENQRRQFTDAALKRQNWFIVILLSNFVAYDHSFNGSEVKNDESSPIYLAK